MEKILEKGLFCHGCHLFLTDRDLELYECYCNGDKFENASLKIVTDDHEKEIQALKNVEREARKLCKVELDIDES
ncbi:hypothetical protein [Metabacillus litoralis]|uniref:hypothetical protein n=1 Tax=Metabacillus litoralis TaxID=152268 RepID=UPI00203AF6C7|nr:hypothetical protein [Metabacillus litoralis]MCM3161004.1 hypothetical protein [Metabacillus litoralis]